MVDWYVRNAFKRQEDHSIRPLFLDVTLIKATDNLTTQYENTNPDLAGQYIFMSI